MSFLETILLVLFSPSSDRRSVQRGFRRFRRFRESFPVFTDQNNQNAHRKPGLRNVQADWMFSELPERIHR